VIIIIDVLDSAGKEGQHMLFRFYYYLIITYYPLVNSRIHYLFKSFKLYLCFSRFH
jgi:hypothetical protein